jgi:hypothetical protein
VVVAVVALVGSTLGVVALAQSDEADVYTACLNEKWGTLTRVAIGTEPARPCRHNQVQVTWDRAGAALEARLAALEERVALQTVGAPSPVELIAAATVNVTTIEKSVGPIESVTQVGAAHYRANFGEDVFGDIPPGSTAFIGLASNSAFSNPAPCTLHL